MGVDVIGELTNRIGVAAIGDEDDAAPIDVDEDGDVVVAAFCGGLVDARRGADAGEIHARDGRADVVEDDAPQSRVVLADETGRGGDRHVRDERHGERLEQQREARALASPTARRPGERRTWCR